MRGPLAVALALTLLAACGATDARSLNADEVDVGCSTPDSSDDVGVEVLVGS